MADFSAMQRYYQDYINRFFREGFLSRDELGIFAQKKSSIKEHSKFLEEQALENLYRRGVQATGGGGQFIATHVTKPTAEAFSQLDFARLSMADKRRQEAMNYAMMKYQEEQKRSAGLWGGIGKVAGTVAGGIAGGFISSGNPMAIIGGAGLGGNLLGSGGGAGMDPEMMAMMQMFQATEGSISFQEMMDKIDALLGGQDGSIPVVETPYWELS